MVKSQIPQGHVQEGPATKEILSMDRQYLSGPRAKGKPCVYVKRKSEIQLHSPRLPGVISGLTLALRGIHVAPSHRFKNRLRACEPS